MGGAFDPPLDMAGGTADMAGERGKRQQRIESQTQQRFIAVFHLFSLMQERNNQVPVFSQSKL